MMELLETLLVYTISVAMVIITLMAAFMVIGFAYITIIPSENPFGITCTSKKEKKN
ncbi:MAG: hypothetical protein KAH25_04870 [Bacteroidales bacterium]|nr:hypothetical protein [Bacteroidales bacterium]